VTVAPSADTFFRPVGVGFSWDNSWPTVRHTIEVDSLSFPVLSGTLVQVAR
jgi:hypothetical protein